MLELTSFVKEQGTIASEYFSNLKLNINEQAGIVNENIHKMKLIIEGSNNKIEEIASISKSTRRKVQNILDSVDKVATYTELRQHQEEAELKREQTLQEKRQTTVYNRGKGKKLTSFESALSEKQIKILTSYCNQIPVFKRDIELQKMKDILLCTHTKPLKVTVNKYVAFLFTELSKTYMYNGKKNIYFSREELERWLMQNPVKTAEQKDKETTDYVVARHRRR